ncbi:GIY-YIG nuclease family protein [Thiomicrorhabdus sp. Milos-T2]|uniref:GIY-YIG nuclease family protein n=1 Tax=Thiomicrorhabdus sp. Milos-T2 TaxID=90814 RepID=UPI0006907565|nr:GIY-YIG nuclease family protein [Thiomicrorhabdus sp. Milos-T2]
MKSEHYYSENEIPLKKYYVYLLIDPRDDSVFYVGKGQGDRALQHAKLAKDNSENAKESQIKDIQLKGLTVKELVIGRYDSESEAFAVEATLIKWVYGFKNLTNSVQGHHSKSIRFFGDYEQVDNIDIPVKKYTNDGQYTESYKKLVVENNVIESVEDLRDYFIQRTQGLEFSAVDDKDPRFVLFRWLHKGLSIAIARPPTKAKFSVILSSPHGTKDEKEQILKICEVSSFNSKKYGDYARYTPDTKSEDYQVLLEGFFEQKRVLEDFFSGKNH